MNILGALEAIAAASVVASFTDWLFMGVLFHDRYMAHPEVWREGRGEPAKILQSQGAGVLACLGFVLLVAHLPHHANVYLAAACLTWLAAPLPMILQNLIWMKLHPLVGLSHALGWLARLLITAGIAFFLLR